jgi:uncharacterized protein DUF4177
MPRRSRCGTLAREEVIVVPAQMLHEPVTPTRRFEYKVVDTGKHVEEELNELGAEGWQVVGVTTRKQLLIAPPAAIILMRELAT